MPHPLLPSIVTPDGVERPLGNHPAPPGLAFPRARAPMSVLAELDWAPFDLRQNWDWPVTVGDQDGYGACNGYAVAGSLEAARYVAGMTHVLLSPWYVYATLCQGVDRGSSIEEGLALASSRGVAADDTVPYGTINPRAIPADADASAARFRVEVGTAMMTWAELGSATQWRQPFNFSLCANNFNAMDAEGVVGLAAGPGNHAVTGGLGAKRLASGEWAILGKNSWGPHWGQGGYFWFTRRHWEWQAWASAYCVFAATDDPLDATNPPPPIVA